MKLVISFVLFSFLVGSIRTSLVPRIVGGSNAEIINFPYQASIRHNGFHLCGGCIISEKHVLTAAHCFRKDVPPYRHMSVSTGTDSSISVGHFHLIAHVTIHPEWTGTWDTFLYNDIAVIKIAGTIRFNAQQQKIELASRNIISGQRGMLTGWGYTLPGREVYSVELQKLEFTLLNNTDCQPQHRYAIREKQLCADHPRGQSACLGDSGGPLVVDNQIVGIMSWIANPNCKTKIPDVYTNVYAHRQFIEHALNK